MKYLTYKQRITYDEICRYWEENAEAPTVRYLMRFFDLKSTAPIMSRLGHLREKGYITQSKTVTPANWDKGRMVLAGSVIAAINDLKAKCGKSGDDFDEVLLKRLQGESVEKESNEVAA